MDGEFRILGPIEVDLAGQDAKVPRGRALALLALLLVHRGAIVPLDRIVDELWEGEGPRNARNAVHVVASRLRAALGDGLIASEGAGYALRLRGAALDADGFEELFRQGRDELAGGDPRAAAATLRRALALWRGPALADVADEGFAQPEIARLEDLRLSCVSERLDADLACGRHAEVAGELEALVREHPLRERLRAQRMLALYRCGRQADALAEYRSAHRALVEGLGIEPSPDLRALETAILRHDVPAPAPTAAVREPVASEARRWVTCLCVQLAAPDALAGLDPEPLRAALARFHGTFQAVCDHHGGVVTELRGDAVAAVFGAPVAHEDDAQRALRAASQLRERGAELPFGMRPGAGVSSGVVVAPAGGVVPVVGEAVSTAERLARAAHAGEIRLAASTWRVVRHAAHATELDGGAFVLDRIDEEAPAIGRRFDRPLIGREAELDRLRETFAHVAGERSPELLAVLGEPGIGKSRLVAELKGIAGDDGRVVIGRCRPYGDGITYWPLREIVVQLKGALSFDELAAALAIPPAVTRRVAAAVGLAGGEADEPEGAFLALLAALARDRPLVLVIDDAHWSEPALLDLLLDIVARLRDVPLLVVWVARPDTEHERLRELGELTLGPLSDTASEALLADIAGNRLAPGDERRIAEAAGGNPLFLEQLVAYVGERQRADALPPAIHALLEARLDRLGATERSALALGAVAGDTFSVASVHALAVGVTRAEVAQACDRLVERDLLIRVAPGRQPAHGELLRFRHALIREAAYASLAKSARARLHERHAEWLELLAGELPEADARIGFHLETACRFEQEVSGAAQPELGVRAGRRLAAAARVARGRGDLPGEIGFLDRAITLLGSDREEGATLLPALAALVSALFETGASHRAEALADRAVTASAALDLPDVHARAMIERERIRLSCHPETFDVAGAIDVAERAATTLLRHGDELGLARTASLVSDLYWLRGDVRGSYAQAKAMLAHARRAGSRFDAATALTFMAWGLVEGPWPVAEGLERCNALAGEAAGEAAAEFTLLGCRAVLLAMTTGYDGVRDDMVRARRGLADLRLDEMGAFLALLDAVAETLSGRAAAAERAARDAERIVAGSGDRWYAAFIGVDVALAILAQGRTAEGAAAVARIETAAAPCDMEWVIKRHMARAMLAEQEGDGAGALAEAQAAVAAADRTDLVVIAANAHRTLAAVERAAGRAPEAAAALTRALELDEAKGNAVAAATTRRLLAALSAVA